MRNSSVDLFAPAQPDQALGDEPIIAVAGEVGMSMSETAGSDIPSPLSDQIRILKCLYFVDGLSASTWGRFGAVYYLQKVSTGFLFGCNYVLYAVSCFVLQLTGVCI